MKFFNDKSKDKVKNIVLSVALGISILTNLYLFTNEKQIVQQNSLQATQVATVSDGQTKQLNDLKNENSKLTNEIKELENEKSEVQTKVNSITEENKNLNTKIS